MKRIVNIICLSSFFTPVLTNGFPPKSKRQQISSSEWDFLKQSCRSQQSYGLVGFDFSFGFPFPLFPYQTFGDRSKSDKFNYFWVQLFFQLIGEIHFFLFCLVFVLFCFFCFVFLVVVVVFLFVFFFIFSLLFHPIVCWNRKVHEMTSC